MMNSGRTASRYRSRRETCISMMIKKEGKLMKRTAVVLACIMMLSVASAAFALMENKKIIEALDGGKIKVGMAKDELVAEIAILPKASPSRTPFFTDLPGRKSPLPEKKRHGPTR